MGNRQQYGVNLKDPWKKAWLKKRAVKSTGRLTLGVVYIIYSIVQWATRTVCSPFFVSVSVVSSFDQWAPEGQPSQKYSFCTWRLLAADYEFLLSTSQLEKEINVTLNMAMDSNIWQLVKILCQLGKWQDIMSIESWQLTRKYLSIFIMVTHNRKQCYCILGDKQNTLVCT